MLLEQGKTKDFAHPVRPPALWWANAHDAVPRSGWNRTSMWSHSHRRSLETLLPTMRSLKTSEKKRDFASRKG